MISSLILSAALTAAPVSPMTSMDVSGAAPATTADAALEVDARALPEAQEMRRARRPFAPPARSPYAPPSRGR
jgi:hypothetical protein